MPPTDLKVFLFPSCSTAVSLSLCLPFLSLNSTSLQMLFLTNEAIQAITQPEDLTPPYISGECGDLVRKKLGELNKFLETEVMHHP